MILFLAHDSFMIFTFFIAPEKAHYVNGEKHESGLERRHRAKQAVKRVLTAIGPKAWRFSPCQL